MQQQHLVALNHLWDLDFTVDQLSDPRLEAGRRRTCLCARLQAAWAEGVGEQLTRR